MKRILVTLFLIAAVIATGCTAASPTPAPTTVSPTASGLPAPTATITNLTGTWAGTMLGYDEGTGYSDFGGDGITMVVTGQHGRIFDGRFQWTINGTQTIVPFAGVIGSDGTSFSLAEKDNGYTTGRIFPDGTMELTYLQAASPYSAGLDTLKRV